MAEVLDIVVRQRGARRVSKDIAAIGVSAQSTSTRLKTFQQQLKGTTTGLNQASGASTKFTQACQKTSRCTNQAAAGLKRTRIGLSGVGTGAFVAGAALSAGFTRPLIAAISAAGEFESAMNLVGVLTSVDRTSKAFENLEQKSLELGRTTQFTAVQAAQGMQFLAKTGLEADEVLGAIPTTLKLAAAASIDLGRASDITTNILKGFRLEMEDLPQAVDILAATFSSSNVDIEQLAQSFKKAGPVAAEFGQEFKDVAAIVGTLGDAGIQAEEAGVALRRLFINLQNDSAKSNSTLRKFGITIEDSVTGKMRPLIDIFRDIDKAGLRPTERIDLFGARALAAAGIIENSSGTLDAFANSLSENVGRAAEIGAARLRGFDGSVTLLKSAMEGLGIAIAKSGLLDFFTKLIQGATTAARALASLPKPVLAVVGAVLTLGAALGAILIPIGLIAVGVSTLAPLVAGLTFAGVAASIGAFLIAAAPFVAALVAIIAAWKAIKDVQFTVGKSTVTLGALMEETFSSISSLIDDAVLGFKLLAQGSGSTTNALVEDSQKIEDNFPSFSEFVASGIAAFEIFGRVVAAVFIRIGKGIAGFSSDIVDAFNSIPEAIKAAFDGDESTDAGTILASKFRNGFITQFDGFGEEIQGIVKDATAKANSALSLLGNTDFVKRAAERTNPTAEGSAGSKGSTGGSGITPPGGGDPLNRFNEQQLAAAEAVLRLTNAIAPGVEAINAMATATNTLNEAQQLGVITGRENVTILKSLREAGGEEFLASINPVTAALRDQEIAFRELAVAKELFNLSDQEAMVAGELIKQQTQERLLQLDQFKNKLSGIDSVRLGLSEGFREFVKGLGTQFDIVSQGVQRLGGVISNSLTTAIKEGEFAFKEFALAVVSAIADMIVQLLIQIALQAVLTALGGGSAGGIAGQAANGGSITPMADGGPIGSAGQTFLVGEQGPELFVPKSSGDIVPNKQTASMMNAQAPPPIVNVQVVNVADDSGVPDAMSTTEGEKVIINTIQKNRNQLKEIL